MTLSANYLNGTEFKANKSIHHHHQHNRRRRENSKTKTSAKVVLFLGNEDEEVIFKKHAFKGDRDLPHIGPVLHDFFLGGRKFRRVAPQ